MALTPVAVIDGRSGRRLNNALTISFFWGDGQPIAKAQQGADDSFGLKLGILFGFRNGSVGKHVLTFPEGGVVRFQTLFEGPTAVTRDGVSVGVIERGETSTATTVDGSVLHFLPHPTEAKSSGAYRMLVHDAAGVQVATLDVVRQGGSWNLGGADLLDLVTGDFRGDVGSSLPIPFQGTRLVLFRDLTPAELDLLLAACCEIALSIRTYVAAMGERGAAWS